VLIDTDGVVGPRAIPWLQHLNSAKKSALIS